MHKKDRQIKELTELNDELESYFRNTIIPQLFIDADLILRKFTPPAMKQFSLTEGDIGKRITDIQENLRFPAIADNIQRVIATSEIVEKEVQTTDYRWYQMNIIPYFLIKENRTNGVIITFVEITARIKDLKDLERLISDYETLLDTISHDIKNPLTSLVLTVDLMKKESADESGRFQSLLNTVENGIRKLQNIINELTDTRMHEHKYQAEIELLDFESILEDVRLTIADSIEKSGTVIKTRINESEIKFVRRQLRSILYNLVSNAIKFRSPDRRQEIFIETECQDDFFVISVRDNGRGIDKGSQEQIFSKYSRLDKTIEGSGIGLYLVKEIVENSGGRIELESQPGKGSTFRVYLKN